MAILVLTNFSNASEAATLIAAKMANNVNEKLVMVNIIEKPKVDNVMIDVSDIIATNANKKLTKLKLNILKSYPNLKVESYVNTESLLETIKDAVKRFYINIVFCGLRSFKFDNHKVLNVSVNRVLNTIKLPLYLIPALCKNYDSCRMLAIKPNNRLNNRMNLDAFPFNCEHQELSENDNINVSFKNDDIIMFRQSELRLNTDWFKPIFEQQSLASSNAILLLPE